METVLHLWTQGRPAQREQSCSASDNPSAERWRVEVSQGKRYDREIKKGKNLTDIDSVERVMFSYLHMVTKPKSKQNQ